MNPRQVGHITQIAREALSNVVQHAAASRVTLQLSYLGEYTRLAVSDNGSGVDWAALNDSAHQQQGIANMHARARMLGGELDFLNLPGGGLELVLTVPCNGVGPSDAGDKGQRA
jgi:signal transduction histidine kinase